MENLTDRQKAKVEFENHLDNYQSADTFFGVPLVEQVGNSAAFLHIVNNFIRVENGSAKLVACRYDTEGMDDKDYIFIDMDFVLPETIEEVYRQVESGKIEPKMVLLIWSDESEKYRFESVFN